MWLGKLTVPNMAPLGWLSSKTSTQTNNDFAILYVSRDNSGRGLCLKAHNFSKNLHLLESMGLFMV